MNNRILSGAGPALFLGVICALLGVTIVIRANRMRESALELERLSAQRDSIAVIHVKLRLRLAEICNPLIVMNRLKSRGFDTSSDKDIRFVLYDDRIPQTGGSVPGHIRQKLSGIAYDSIPELPSSFSHLKYGGSRGETSDAS